MNIRKQSLQVKKNIALLLHIIFLCTALAGVSLMYLNSNYGKGLHWIQEESYEDTPIFLHQIQSDIDDIFKYVDYKAIFETNGQIDYTKPVVTISGGPGNETTYTLDEMIRYAKSRGLYLDSTFQLRGEFVSKTVEEDAEVLVDWRAYRPDEFYSEPGEAYSSLAKLSEEILVCLGEYYSTYSSLIEHPTNLQFQVYYEGENASESVFYSNQTSKASIEEMKALGKYIYIVGDSVIADSNLSSFPPNISLLMESHNPFNNGNYYIMVAVNIDYPYSDSYSLEAANYRNMRSLFLLGLVLLTIGLIVCFITLWFLVLSSGYAHTGDQTIRLHGFDYLSTESGILLCMIVTTFMIFLADLVGYRLVHLVLSVRFWPYGERLLRAVLIYACCMGGAFSLLRRYKARILWSNSLLKHTLDRFSTYTFKHSFSNRLISYYCIYIICNLVLFGAFIFFLLQRGIWVINFILILLVLLWAIMNLWVFQYLYHIATQREAIKKAIYNISSGDTDYQIDTTDFSGKEKKLAENVNHISTGLGSALQEQIKSERLKADLITNVSHDIKTPLTSIINYVDLIKRENIQDLKIQSYLDILEQKAHRLNTLTEDLVEASKASSGNLTLEIMDIDLIELIHQTNGEFEEKFASRHLELVTNLPDTEVLIEADGRRLWRVLENLYNNAFKYSMEHSRVYVDVEQLEHQVAFTIKNVSQTPLNINSEELTLRFVRGDVARSTDGSGLGLSIAKSLTELQNGDFQILIDGDLFKVQVKFLIKQAK